MNKQKSLFCFGSIKLSSGMISSFKIECDALTDEDWQCLAYLISQNVSEFGSLEGVYSGGHKLAQYLYQYRSSGPLLIVDDVLTTGASIEKQRNKRDAIGAVVFSRGKCPKWITPLFQMIPLTKDN